MKAVRIQVLAICAVAFVLGRSAFGQQGEGERLIAEGDKLAWLKNWQAAEPFFEKAEVLFRERGDKRNELYARISRMRGQLPSRGLFETSTYLASVLDDPLTKDDARLRLRCLTVKGDVDLDFDTALAARDWTEVLSIAKHLEDAAWVNRANGELGIISFVQGDYRTGTVRVMGALSQATKLNDMGAQIRYLTLVGDGLIQLQRNDQAISMFDQALAVAQTIPDLGQPVMTYAGKAQALAALGRTAEAQTVAETLLVKDPLLQLDANEASPRIAAMFTEVRKRVLPRVIRSQWLRRVSHLPTTTKATINTRKKRRRTCSTRRAKANRRPRDRPSRGGSGAEAGRLLSGSVLEMDMKLTQPNCKRQRPYLTGALARSLALSSIIW